MTNWRVVCAICGSIPVIVAILMPFLPETPNWLVAKNKREDAYKVFPCNPFLHLFLKNFFEHSNVYFTSKR